MRDPKKIQQERREIIKNQIILDPEFEEIINIDNDAQISNIKLRSREDKFLIKMDSLNIDVVGGVYETIESTMDFRCQKCGHEWSNVAKKVVLNSCPACHKFELVRNAHIRLWTKTKRIIQDKKGKLVKLPEINPEVRPVNRDEFLVQCAEGHTFLTSHLKLKRNSWCPFCHANSTNNIYLESSHVYGRGVSAEKKLTQLKQICELKNSIIVDTELQNSAYTLICKTCNRSSKRSARQICENRYLCDGKCVAGNKFKLSDMG